jgi:hypothetical protein
LNMAHDVVVRVFKFQVDVRWLISMETLRLSAVGVCSWWVLR